MKALVAEPDLSQIANEAHQLVCLSNITNLLSSNSKPIPEILTTFVHLIPESWQYSDITCVRLTLGHEIITSANFNETKWKLLRSIMSSEKEIGTLEVFYLEARPEEFEGPFLKAEGYLSDNLAAYIGSFIERRELIESQKSQHSELVLYSSLLRHDIKNDLGVILANIDLGKMIFQNSGIEWKEIFGSIEFVCDRIMNLLNAFGRKDNEIDQNLISIIDKVSLIAREIHSSLTIRIINHEESDSFLVQKSNLLPLVFENLLRNSAVHAGESCIVTIEFTKVDQKVLVRISDNGKGIADEVRDRLFQKGASTRGGGLGLFLSRQVVETISGTIELVPSRKGEGAVFEITLPLVIVTQGGNSND